MILAMQFNTAYGNKRRKRPNEIISLDIDYKFKRFEYNKELIEKVMKAWQPIKAKA